MGQTLDQRRGFPCAYGMPDNTAAVIRLSSTMQDFIRVLILLVLGAIVVSLGSALLHLSRGGRGSEEESRGGRIPWVR